MLLTHKNTNVTYIVMVSEVQLGNRDQLSLARAVQCSEVE